MAAIHETIDDLHAAGVVNKTTLRRFDEACAARRVALSKPLTILGAASGPDHVRRRRRHC